MLHTTIYYSEFVELIVNDQLPFINNLVAYEKGSKMDSRGWRLMNMGIQSANSSKRGESKVIA